MQSAGDVVKLAKIALAVHFEFTAPHSLLKKSTVTAEVETPEADSA